MSTPDDAVAEAREWYASNWSSDLTLGEWWDRLGRSGWGFPGWPKEWFGRGLASGPARAVVSDRIRSGVFGPPTGIATFLAAPTILAHGTAAPRNRRRGFSPTSPPDGRSGVSSSPSPVPAPIWPHCRRGPSAMATSGW